MDRLPADTDSTNLDARLGRVLDDVCARRARGERLADADVLANHPELADELRPQLAVLRELRARSLTDEWIARGLFARTPAGDLCGELGGYPIEGVIGHGGMGLVLRARDERLRRPVALKVLRPELAEDAPALARFEREARAAASLQHPNIVSVYGLGSERGLPFLVMEYVDGPSLAEVLRSSVAPAAALRPHLPALLVRHLFRQLLEALAAAHAAGLIHRDVKPSNLLLQGWRDAALTETEWNPGKRQPEGSAAGPQRTTAAREEHALQRTLDSLLPTLKLADFGLARLQSAGTQVTLTHSVLGTPDYMSPEQARGELQLDQRADLYAAGVVLYEMLAGRTPFRTDTPTATIHRILHEEPAHPRQFAPEVDPVLASLALRLMAKAPADRLGTAGEALRVLEEDRPTALVQERRRRGRRIARMLVGTALVVALIFVGVLLARTPWSPLPRGMRAVRHEILAVHVDETDEHLIRATWSDSATPTAFVTMEVPVARDAVLVLPAAPRRPARVYAGLDRQWHGANLLAFDEAARECWRVELADSRSWPDCGAPGEWATTCLAAGPLAPGMDDALVAIAHDQFLYPSRVSLVDPATGVVHGTFWHTGHLSEVLIVPDLLGSAGARRPGLLVWGLNNKLDGFRERRPGDDPHRTVFDCVSVMMVLDPLDLDGLGPPRVDRTHVDLPPARPVAYAFLDLPAAVNPADQHDGIPRGKLDTPVEDFAAIERVDIAQNVPGEPPAVVLHLVRPHGDVRMGPVGRGLLRLTASLDITGFDPATREAGPGREESYWRTRWHVIVRDGVSMSE